jgi:hypothetical protein
LVEGVNRHSFETFLLQNWETTADKKVEIFIVSETDDKE